MPAHDQNEIPIVDLSGLNLSADLADLDLINDLSPEDTVVRKLAKHVVKAFTDIGFCYLVNHGVPQKLINTFNEKTAAFFELPTDIKLKYHHTDPQDPTGWQGPLEEQLDPTSKPDFKEVYNITPKTIKNWPETEVPGFKPGVMELYNSMAKLCHVILKLIGIGLDLDDPSYFVRMNGIATRPMANMTTIRAAYYPPVPRDIAEKGTMLRCGEHSDYGSITLLCQDNVGGLEVKNREGNFVPATPIDGSIIVNLGDMMQRWTADGLLSTKHKVVIPETELENPTTRRSIAFFGMPDDDAVIRCVDKSDKYPPVTPYEYAVEKMERLRIHGLATGDGNSN